MRRPVRQTSHDYLWPPQARACGQELPGLIEGARYQANCLPVPREPFKGETAYLGTEATEGSFSWDVQSVEVDIAFCPAQGEREALFDSQKKTTCKKYEQHADCTVTKIEWSPYICHTQLQLRKNGSNNALKSSTDFNQSSRNVWNYKNRSCKYAGSKFIN